MRIMALIPARKGSKRLKNKNRKPLGGKPLIQWSIEFAQSCEFLEHILISSDDPEIIQLGLEMGCLAPWVRPQELSGDYASSVDVALHALDWFENMVSPIDGLLLLQPTSPFRKKESLLKLIDAFVNDPSIPSVSVSELTDNPKGLLTCEDGIGRPYFVTGKDGRASPSAFIVNGSMYLCSPNYLRKNKDFLGECINTVLLHSPAEAVDIDDQKDFNKANFLLETRNAILGK